MDCCAKSRCIRSHRAPHRDGGRLYTSDEDSGSDIPGQGSKENNKSTLKKDIS